MSARELHPDTRAYLAQVSSSLLRARQPRCLLVVAAMLGAVATEVAARSRDARDARKGVR